MRAVTAYTVACAVLAMAGAWWLAVLPSGGGRLVVAIGVAAWTCGARAGVQQIEVATRPAGRRP